MEYNYNNIWSEWRQTGKELFYEELQEAVDKTNNTVKIIGDVNARVSNSTEKYATVIGKYGERACNNSGTKLCRILHSQ